MFQKIKEVGGVRLQYTCWDQVGKSEYGLHIRGHYKTNVKLSGSYNIQLFKRLFLISGEIIKDKMS